jgi:hypothetical protein
VSIDGKTSQSYTLVAEDLGKYIRVTVSRAENGETISSNAVGAVGLPILAGTVSITGTPQTGLTLSAVTTSLAGSGTISYQWLRSDAADSGFTVIANAAGDSYTLAAADLNKYIRIRVSRAENSGTVISAPTELITPQPPGKRSITIGFNYGDIEITGDDGSNIIYKGASPNSIELSATDDYAEVKWYINGNATPASTTASITLNASDYSVKNHSITFTGRLKKNGVLYSRAVTFTVKY